MIDYNADMGKKRATISDQIRAAVESSGMSRYHICKETGIDQGVLSRFMDGTGITTSTVDKLADYLGLEITVRPKNQKRGK